VRKIETIGRPVVGAPKFYTVAETARIFEMSSMTMYRAIGDKQFPAIKVRGRYTVPADVIQAMADAAMAQWSVVDAADWVRK
jgi:hypothetical protein